MRDVEVGGRLVEQQQARTLTERHGEKDALPLTAGEGMHLALGECGDVRGLHRPRDCLAILRIRTCLKEPRVGKASVGDKLLHGQPLRRRTFLRQDGTHACKFFLGVAAEFTSIQPNLARITAVQSCERTQECGLARAVGANDGSAPPCGDVDAEPVQDLLARNFDAEITRHKSRTHSCLLRR